MSLFQQITIAALSTSWFLCGNLLAQDKDTKDERGARLEFMKQSAAAYHFEIPKDKRDEVALVPEPILRWSNEVVREDDAALFLWTHRKRPVCGAQFFLQDKVWHHEFQSLTAEPFKGSWRGENAWQWAPGEAGVKWSAAALEVPADKPRQRLVQMRAFAERFSAAVDPSASRKFQDPHQLRLLPTPVYRYADEEQRLVDGAIFAFVQGTNPEVLLLLEAIREKAGGAAAWRFAFAPMTSFEARVTQGDKVVWQQDVATVPTRDEKSPYQFRWAVLPRTPRNENP